MIWCFNLSNLEVAPLHDVIIRVNLSTWAGSVKRWRPMLLSTNPPGIPPVCPASSETTACWLRKTSYGWCSKPRSDNNSSEITKMENSRPFLPVTNMCNFGFPSKVFVGLGFPYEGPAPIEAISLGCVFLQPRFSAPHSSDSNDFYSGKPTTRRVRKWKPHSFIKTRSDSDPDMSDPRYPPSTRTRKHSLANPTCGQWTWPTRLTCLRRFEPYDTQRW